MWTNPTGADFAGTMIRYKTSGYPTSSGDGTQCYTGTGTSFVHTGLTNGATYYYSAFAYDGFPNYSTKADASGVPIYFDAKQTKLAANNTSVTLTAGVISAAFPDFFYVQNEDSPALSPIGIRVNRPGHGLAAGLAVGAKGTVLTDPTTGEKYLSAVWAQTSSSASVTAKAMGGKSVGGVDFSYSSSTGAGQAGMTSAIGPNNVGLLVTVWGKVNQRQTALPKYFYIDDGSVLRDGTTTPAVGGIENVGVRVAADPSGYPEGSYVSVTGVVSCFSSGGLRPQLLPAGTGIQVLRP
jgi:hypothetical protein